MLNAYLSSLDSLFCLLPGTSNATLEAYLQYNSDPPVGPWVPSETDYYPFVTVLSQLAGPPAVSHHTDQNLFFGSPPNISQANPFAFF